MVYVVCEDCLIDMGVSLDEADPYATYTKTRNEEQLVANKLGSPRRELIFFCMYFAGCAIGHACGREHKSRWYSLFVLYC